MRIVFLTILIISLLYVSYLVGTIQHRSYGSFEEIGKPVIQLVQFTSANQANPISFVVKKWGFPKERQFIALTSATQVDENWLPDYDRDIIWHGKHNILYERHGDSLQIYFLDSPSVYHGQQGFLKVGLQKVDSIKFLELREIADRSPKVLN